MNADRLLEHFERISDAADAVPRLRRLVLDLAVRGRLVPQDPREESASQLLARIEAEINRLAAERVITKKKVSAPISLDAHPLELPRGWAVTRLGSIITLIGGQHLQPNEYTAVSGAGLPYITGPADFDGTGLRITRYALKRKAVARIGQLLLTVKGAGVGKTTICTVPEVAISRQLMALTAVGWDSRYLVLITHALAEVLKENARSLIPGIGREDVEMFVLALPPLQEQGRIVAKVDELMALCDRLEAAHAEREARRDRLVSASLARVTEADSDDATSRTTSARFHLDHFGRLATRPEHVKQLRQTILNLAVRGRLVPHSEVWQRKTLAELCPLITSGSRGWAAFYAKSGAAFIRAQNIRFGMLRLDDLAYVAPPTTAETQRCRLHKGDLLIVITGAGVTTPACVDRDLGEAYVSQHVALTRPTDTNVSPWLLLCLMATQGCRGQLVERAYGAGKPGLNLDNIRTLEVPLPTLAEQRRIVAKVEELMILCDQLEASVASAATDRARLLEALLHEALAPAA
jgi:type I restriction enzyme, S subunit